MDWAMFWVVLFGVPVGVLLSMGVVAGLVWAESKAGQRAAMALAVGVISFALAVLFGLLNGAAQ